jgi:hypothetical protein
MYVLVVAAEIAEAVHVLPLYHWYAYGGTPELGLAVKVIVVAPLLYAVLVS